MSSIEDAKNFYKSGTRSSIDKLRKKFAAKASSAVSKLKDPDNQQAWHDNVSAEKALRNYKSSVNKLSAEDLTRPMNERGISNYTTSTGAQSTVDKWANKTAPYIAVAQEVSANKKPVRSTEDAIDNVRSLIEGMQKKKDEISGVS